MTDRELLVSAAMAAGLHEFLTRTPGASPRLPEGEDIARPWNPLVDDGDALRLAVKLNLHRPIAEAHRGITDKIDFYAATRRAIVRAAAALAK